MTESFRLGNARRGGGGGRCPVLDKSVGMQNPRFILGDCQVEE
jgi:hypothetical protein